MSNSTSPEEEIMVATDVVETVSFDVGGKLHRVARSTLELYGDSMLAKLVSERWQNNGGDHQSDSEPIFIDRDGDRFGHVLDYLRYGMVALPKTVFKEMFLKDMDFYGLSVVNEGITIKHDCVTVFQQTKHLEVVQTLIHLAEVCVVQVCGMGLADLISKTPSFNMHTSSHKMSSDALRVLQMGNAHVYVEVFNNIIEPAGLRLKKIEVSAPRGSLLCTLTCFDRRSWIC
jgi:hypothetical protein